MSLAGIGALLVAAGFLLSAAFCGVVRRLAPRVGLVDRPGGRKAHRRPTPMGGGVAVWLTLIVLLGLGAGLVYLQPFPLPAELARHAEGLRSRHAELAGIMGLATLIMLMGLADDRWALSWKPRLAVQVTLAAVFVAVWGGRITLFLPDAAVFRWVSATITVLWIVALTNAFNFLDNMDGLAASVGLIVAALFAAAQAVVGGLFVPTVLLVLVGALAGFLVHNWCPARLFMGDAGSNLLGFLLGVLTVAGTFTRPYEGQSSPYSVFTPLLVMALPLYDMVSVIWIRIREGRSPFQADRRHFSHRLVDRGLTPPLAVATIDLVTLAGGLGALLLHRLGGRGTLIVLVQALTLLGIVAILESTGGARGPGSPPVPLPSESSDGAAIPDPANGPDRQPA